MVISQPALVCLHATWHRFLGKPLSLWRRLDGRLRPRAGARPQAPTGDGEPMAPVTSMAEPAADGAVGSPVTSVDETPPLTATERRARTAAFRGLLLARQRRFAAAQTAFIEAVRLDPALELTAIPTFWHLERGAHEAAVRAYAEVGRPREAAMLTARLRSTFRPRLVTRRPKPAPTAP